MKKKKAKRHHPFVVPNLDPIACAKEAGLHYVDDRTPGIRRVKSGKGFRYLRADGKPLRQASDLGRIRSLVIPPAWTDVWICADPRGHLQATGRDARGRKQYRYHPLWAKTRDQTKYEKMLAFGAKLPQIRSRVSNDMSKPGLPREKVLATLVRLLETTLIRVGNEEYARENKSYGLTTLREKHAEVEGTRIHFHFRGKSGVSHDIDVRDRRLAAVVRKCQELPGQELFQYVDAEGARHPIGSSEVNAYLQEVAGEEFTAKDFRTWAGTVMAARALQEFEAFDSQTQAKRNIVQAIESVAKCLGNTKAVCRKCYVHPAVLDAYLDGTLLDTLTQRVEHELESSLAALRPEEAAVLAFLQERLKRESAARAAA